MLDRFKKFNARMSTWMEWVGLVAIMLMILITCVDVIGAKIFLRPVFGAIDIVMLAQLIAIAFAVGATLLMGRHVQVEFFVMMLPQKLQAIVDAVIQVLGLGLFILITWQLFVYAHLLRTTGEVSSTARIPLHYFAYAVALSLIPVCLILLYYLLKSIYLVVKK